MPLAARTLSPCPRRSRRGGVYVMVMVTVVVVVAIACLGLQLQRSQLRGANLSADAAQSRLLARSAVEAGLETIRSDANWRTSTSADGKWIVKQAMGRGLMSLTATDPADGSIPNKATDPLVLVGRGEQGQAAQLVSVRLNSRYEALSGITRPLYCSGNLTFNTLASVSGAGTLTSAGAAGATLSTVLVAVQAKTVTGATYLGGTSTLKNPLDLPGQSVLTAFGSGAVTIDVTQLSSRRIEKCVLSPGSNPYGPVSPSGVYIIDCKTKDFELRDCRIAATLIVRNCNDGMTVSNSVLCEPWSSDMPALLIDGDTVFQISSGNFSEGSIGVNLNPPGSPYQGATNSNKLDSYPSCIRGVVCVFGNVTAKSGSTFNGSLQVAGRVSVSGSPAFNHDATLVTAPPQGFRTGPVMSVDPTTWAQVVP